MRKVEEELMLAAKSLISPSSSSSAQQLLPLLDKLESCLTMVNQSPSNSMLSALDPIMKELAKKELLNHSDMDVKVSVASCITQILRIASPNAPYGDEQMKEILHLIVGAFENISYTSSPSYCKRVSILETFASIGSWTLMVDLRCYSSILEMFTHFLTNIREDHPSVVFSSMELIMILVLDKLEEIPPELLSLLLRSVSQDVLPIARRLGERVIENCNSKLIPYMHQAEHSTSFPSEYSGKKGSCGKKLKRTELQDSPVVDKDKEESSEEQVSEEENREKGEKGEEKIFEDEETEEELLKEKKRKRAKRDQNQKSPKKTGSKGHNAIKTRCSQVQMHDFLSNLKGKKRSIIQSSIFSAFLNIPKRPVRPSLVHALIECYDAEKDAFIFGGQPLKFCDKEVEKCIGLSFEGKRVDFEKGYVSPLIARRYFELVNGNSRITDDAEAGAKKKKLDEETRSFFSIPTTRLLQKLKQMSVDDKSDADDFLRLSILYMFNVYFFSSNNKLINQWPLKYLENIDELGSYAWGYAAYEYLRKSLQKAAGHFADVKEIHTYLNGCVPLFETLAYERIKKLDVQVHKKNLHPLVLKYKKGECRSLDTIRNVLANLQPDEIKKCEDCEELPS